MKESNKRLSELLIILLASAILALTVSFNEQNLLLKTFIYFIIILGVNSVVKKIVGYLFEIKVDIKFWSMYQFGFKENAHFKKPVPMLWLPLILALFSRGLIWWLPILEFDVDAKTERVSKRHGLYRFTNVTEWHILLIAIWGLIANLLLAIAGYLAGFEIFAKLSIFFIVWSLVPFSSLDGSKIFFRSRAIWLISVIVSIIFLMWGLTIV